MLHIRIQHGSVKLDTLELLQASASLATILSVIINIAFPENSLGHLRMIDLAPLLLVPHHLFLYCRMLLAPSGSAHFNSVDIMALYFYTGAYMIGTNVAVLVSLAGSGRWYRWMSFINRIALGAVLVGAIVQCGLLVMLCMRTHGADEQGVSLSQDAAHLGEAPPSTNDGVVSDRVTIAS
jgi:hypothetical protein